MWHLKFVNTDVKWHDFSRDQKDVVDNLCVLSFGAGVMLTVCLVYL